MFERIRKSLSFALVMTVTALVTGFCSLVAFGVAPFILGLAPGWDLVWEGTLFLILSVLASVLAFANAELVEEEETVLN